MNFENFIAHCPRIRLYCQRLMGKEWSEGKRTPKLEISRAVKKVIG